MLINYWTKTVVICVLVYVCCVAGFTERSLQTMIKNSFNQKAGQVWHLNDRIDNVTYIGRDVIDTQKRCPSDCRCSWWTVSKLTISCLSRTTNIEFLSRELDAYLLNFLSDLTSLSMTDIPLQHLPESVCKLERLKTIRLLKNPLLSSLPDNCFTRLHNLESFVARNSGLTSLQNGLFDNLNNLVWVKFVRNNISSIGSHLFDVTANLPNLTTIDLTANRLTEIDTWPLRRAQLINGSNINLSYNRVSKFTNSLGWQYNCSSAPLRLRNSTIDLSCNNIINLKNLLQGWNITGYLDIFCFLQTPIFGQSHEVQLRIENNPLICDCRDYDIIAKLRIFTHSSWLDGLRCNLPSQLHDEKVPMILVGNKCDLEDERVVGKDQGQGLARQWNSAFLETSAKSKINVNEIFYDLVRQINRKNPDALGRGKKDKKSRCSIL